MIWLEDLLPIIYIYLVFLLILDVFTCIHYWFQLILQPLDKCLSWSVRMQYKSINFDAMDKIEKMYEICDTIDLYILKIGNTEFPYNSCYQN